MVNLKLGNTFLVPSEWCMTELALGTSAERSIGEKSGLVPLSLPDCCINRRAVIPAKAGIHFNPSIIEFAREDVDTREFHKISGFPLSRE